jgi:cob(I)alamin adenosyltransferase
MGYRLSKIYTRTGDQGETGLGDGARVPKDGLRVETLGDVDELNSHIGVVLSQDVPGSVRECLEEVQHDLFHLGGELAVPGRQAIDAEDISALEEVLDGFNKDLPPLREFVLPGGGPAAAACYVARAVCRRAERHLVALSRTEPVNADGLRYLNRLSDLLFVLARTLVWHEGGAEILWDPGRGQEE